MRKLLTFLVVFALVLPTVASAASANIGGYAPGDIVAKFDVPQKAQSYQTRDEERDSFFCGFTITGDETNGFAGFVSVDLNNPDEYGVVCQIGDPVERPAFNSVYGMEYNANDGNTYLCYITTDGYSNFGTVNVRTGEFTKLTYISTLFVHLTMDYSANRMYALSADCDIFFIDFDTGYITYGCQIQGTDDYLLVMAMSGYGELFGIDMAGVLYSIKLETSSVNRIGHTGLGADYFQSMVYDYETGQMYWAQYDSTTQSSGLYALNTITAQPTRLGSLDGIRITGLHVQPYNFSTIEGVNIIPGDAAMPNDTTLQLKTALLPEDGEFGEMDFIWTSSNPSVATISDTGLVSSHSEGATMITVETKDGKFSNSAEIRVLPTCQPSEFEYFPISSGNTYDIKIGDEDSAFFEISGRTRPAYGMKLEVPNGGGAAFSIPEDAIKDIEKCVFYVYNENFELLPYSAATTAYRLYEGTKQFVPDEPGTYYILVTTMDDAELTGGRLSIKVNWLSGDANSDGLVNTGDAATILMSVVGGVTLNDAQIELADFNNDNVVNTGDAAAILFYILGK